MTVEDANTLLQTFRRAVSDTCAAKAIFNAHLTGSTEEYQAADKMLKGYLLKEATAYVACQSGMLDCGCQQQESGRARAIVQAHKERALDYAEETAREETT